MDFVSNIGTVCKSWKPSDAWNIEQKKNKLKDEKLLQKYPISENEKDYYKRYAETIVNAVDIMDQTSINKSEDALMTINGLVGIMPLVIPVVGSLIGYAVGKSGKSKTSSPKISAFNGFFIANCIMVIAYRFASAQLEKITTRIARYQTRKKDLKDTRNFVIYNNKQIQEAENIAKNIKDVNTSEFSYKDSLNPIKSYKNSIKTLKEMKDDYNGYKKWLQDFKEKEKIKTATNDNKLNPKLVSAIGELEIASNNSEINMEYAVSLLQFCTQIAGISFVALFVGLLNKLQNKTTNTVLSKTANIAKYASVPLTLFSVIFLTSPLLKIQKESAKLGRHELKQQMLNTPEYFVRFNDTQRNEIRDEDIEIPENKTPLQNLNKDISDIKKMPKKLKQLEEYKQNEGLEKFKLRKALKQVEVSDKQLEDAKKLQKEVFYCFETIDEKSESFVDDVHAAVSAINLSILSVISTLYNIVTLKLLTNKLKVYNENRMPDFFEGLKLLKKLKGRDFAKIFIIPYVVKSTLSFLFSTISMRIRKKACNIGVMNATTKLTTNNTYKLD